MSSKTILEAYSRPRANGINAITVRDGDMLLEAVLVNREDELMVASKMGKVVRFSQYIVKGDESRYPSCNGTQRIWCKRSNITRRKDEVIGMIVMPKVNPPQVLVVSEKGYGKRSDVEDYRQTRRGGKGVKTINITEKTGNLVAIKAVTDENDLLIITTNGIVIRLSVADLRVMGRATQGVRLINLGGSDEIGAVTTVESDPEEEHVKVDGSVDTSMEDAADETEPIDETDAGDDADDVGTDVETNDRVD